MKRCSCGALAAHPQQAAVRLALLLLTHPLAATRTRVSHLLVSGGSCQVREGKHMRTSKQHCVSLILCVHLVLICTPFTLFVFR